MSQFPAAKNGKIAFWLPTNRLIAIIWARGKRRVFSPGASCATQFSDQSLHRF